MKIKEVSAETIGGLVMELLEHIPSFGEQVMVGEHRITIIAAEPTYVRVLSIEKVPASEQKPDDNKV